MKHLQEKADRAWSKKGASLLALATLLNGSLLAGTAAAVPLVDQTIKTGEKFPLHSRFLNEDRICWVYLPLSYQDETSAHKRYPVLYALDGEGWFLTASGMVQYMSFSENLQIPELIVVAILDTDRTRDFTPSHSLKNINGRENPDFASSGGADAFSKFLKEELLPQIDSHYRTAPYRILMGGSFGGTFVVKAFLDQPSLFRAWIANDPALWWDDQILARKAKKILPQATDLHASFYMSLANHSYFKAAGLDPAAFDDPCEEFAALIKTNASPQLRSKSQRFEADDHPSVMLMGLYEGLLFAFDGYKPSPVDTFNNPSTLNEHFAEVSKRLGYKILPPEQYVESIGYATLTQINDIDKAIALFNLNTANYPRSFHAYDCLANAYANKGDKESAIKNFKKSLELNPKDQDAVEQLKKLEQR